MGRGASPLCFGRLAHARDAVGRDYRVLRVRGDGVGGAGRDVAMCGWVVDGYLGSWLGRRGLGWNRCFRLGVLSCDVSCSVAWAVSTIHTYCEYRLGRENPIACLLEKRYTLYRSFSFLLFWFPSSGSLFRHSFACGGHILGRFVSTWQSTELRPCFGYLDVPPIASSSPALPHRRHQALARLARWWALFRVSSALTYAPSGPDIRSGCLSGPT